MVNSVTEPRQHAFLEIITGLAEDLNNLDWREKARIWLSHIEGEISDAASVERPRLEAALHGVRP